MTQFQIKVGGLVQGVPKLITTFSAPETIMLVMFTKQFVDSSYLGCWMFFHQSSSRDLRLSVCLSLINRPGVAGAVL